MEKVGFIEIKVSGSKGKLDLNPDTFDIKELITILENAEDLLFPDDKKERPIISYKIESGSVRHIFKTSIQYIIGFNAVIGQVSNLKNIDFLDFSTARAIENIQVIAKKKDYVFQISTSIDQTNEIKIDRNSRYVRKESTWADAEFYFYGKITNAGGKGKANVHVLTDDLGIILIQTPLSFFENLEENIIHKKEYGIRATGRQNLETGEIDTSSLKFLELINYDYKYDDTYLSSLRNKARDKWLGKIDPDSWLRNLRGGYDA